MSKISMVLSTYRACVRVTQSLRNVRNISSSSKLCDESKDKENEKQKMEPAADKKDVEKKLNDLLMMMINDAAKSTKNIDVPKPRVKAQEKHKKFVKEEKERIEREENEKLGNRLASAAAKVANTLGDDTTKTEEELLEIYLYGKEKSPTEKSAKMAGEKPDLGSLLTSMKIEKESQLPRYESRAAQVRVFRNNIPDDMISQASMKPRNKKYERIDIFGETPFNIFTLPQKEDQPSPPVLPTWDYLFQRDLRLSVTHPPSNIFEQMILWTEQGKLWRFPIDNEQDWFEEENVDFTEHVFLKHWLEPWCPKSGPIRHFMELVCTGLSKNPYLSVQEKREHISFYEHYFRGKNALLQELGMEVIPEKESQLSAK